MKRRAFLRTMAMATPTFVFGAKDFLGQDATAPRWRTWEITTSVEILGPSGQTHIWLPQPLLQETTFQRTLSFSLRAEGGKTSFHEDRIASMKMLQATFPAGTPAEISTTHRVATRDWSVDLNAPSARKTQIGAGSESHFVKPTRYVPTDGIVKQQADEITKGSVTDLEKTQAIYAWIVKNTYRNPKVRGCGTGDIKPMLESGDLGGKCADLNALFVGLVKAAGIPARDVYGIRLGHSDLSCKSLGTSSGAIGKAQHCRAEVFLTGFGWVPMDPADVRKVVLEELPGSLTLSDTKVQLVQQRLFGSWEMNWMAYNYSQDVILPGSKGPALHFLMYPQAETDAGRLDCLDPDSFRYNIASREVTI